MYCVIAIAACIEAIANRLRFEVDGEYKQENNSPVGRINTAARKLAERHGISFNSLGGKRQEYKSMEQVRVLRNTFMHATEAGAPIDTDVFTSSQLATIAEPACRELLRDLRLTVAFVFDQLPWVQRPINTAQNVRWLGELEVP